MVMSEKSAPLLRRLPGLVGLKCFRGMVLSRLEGP